MVMLLDSVNTVIGVFPCLKIEIFEEGQFVQDPNAKASSSSV